MQGSHSRWSEEIRTEIYQLMDQLKEPHGRQYLNNMTLAGLIEVKDAVRATLDEQRGVVIDKKGAQIEVV